MTLAECIFFIVLFLTFSGHMGKIIDRTFDLIDWTVGKNRVSGRSAGDEKDS